MLNFFFGKYVFQDCRSLSKRLKTRNKEIEGLRTECKRRKQVIQTQQSCILQGKDPTTFRKASHVECTLCRLMYLDVTLVSQRCTLQCSCAK